tara:strand:+ start:1134 stop:2015 length:882 start_codon:yes stop_codon:yes gene_type:complete
MRANLIGVGYWGSFIYKTLKEIGFREINLCDPEVPGAYNNYKKMEDAEFIFIATPVSSHYEICEYFLSQGKRVFCEKPLVVDEQAAANLYNIAEKHNTFLFVDWVFTYNYGLELIKQYISDKTLNSESYSIQNIHMSRKNTNIDHISDINAKLDLAGHDVSILLTLTKQLPLTTHWHEYRKIKESTQMDSALGCLTFGTFNATIDVSWYNAYKDRECVIKLGEEEYIIWDDAKQTVSIQKNFRDYPVTINYNTHASPLERSIKQFLVFNENAYQEQKRLTYDILRILNNDGKI